MNIPDSPRVIYELNPLVEVNCKLTFPPILKIASQEPAEFQERIRFKYPLYEIEQNVSLPPEFYKILQKFNNPVPTDFIYQFTSEDLAWRVLLYKDFLALATRQYRRYEEFKQRLQEVVEAFEDVFQPSFYSPVSLKYQDLIIRSYLGLESEKWSELLQPYIANHFHIKEFADDGSINNFLNIINLKLDEGELIFKNGLLNIEDEEGREEQAYLLEAEFFNQKNLQKGNNVWECLDKYNRLSGKLFRWSITEKLHNAMQPQPIES